MRHRCARSTALERPHHRTSAVPLRYCRTASKILLKLYRPASASSEGCKNFIHLLTILRRYPSHTTSMMNRMDAL